jgi:hypothetical protein
MKTEFHACGHPTQVSDDASEATLAVIRNNNCQFCNNTVLRNSVPKVNPKKAERQRGQDTHNQRAKSPRPRVIHTIIDTD